jgi:very-short-patch-repair endonuclease
MTNISPHTRANARRLRTEMTPQERKVWMELRDLNHCLGLHFRRQAAVGHFIADFVDFGRRLVIEVDGGLHGGPEDTARDAWFQGQGFTVLRFWNSDVDGNLEGVMQLVLDALEGGLE